VWLRDYLDGPAGEESPLRGEQLTSGSEQPRFDVAISFLHADLKIAQGIRDQLTPTLSCFVYDRYQEQIAGRDGQEKFRTVFKKDSRLNVVLYRNGWGETDWTAVEAQAIKDSALHSHWRNLFFVLLEAKSTPPEWLPETLINLDYTVFGLTETVGAIRSRALELHASFKQESTVELATRLERERASKHRRRSAEISDEGLRSGLTSANAVIAQAIQIAKELRESLPNNIRIEHRAEDGNGYVQIGWARVDFEWDPDAITNGASVLIVTLMNSVVMGSRNRNWKQTARTDYEARLSATDEWVWRAKAGEELAPAALAEEWIQKVLRAGMG
jgi:hypothetical protein